MTVENTAGLIVAATSLVHPMVALSTPERF
ncbi:K(+)-transporting ATPase subunit F [Streptomyces sp. NPDC102274]